MKKIRLEIPLGREEKYLPWKEVWLKVDGSQTKAFEDRYFNKPIHDTGRKVSFEVQVPNELQKIEIVGLGGTTPEADIAMTWCFVADTNPKWRIPGLKKVTIIFDDRTHEVPVINERPDTKEWDYYREHEADGWLFLKRWALAVYTFENETIASLYWHSYLITKGI